MSLEITERTVGDWVKIPEYAASLKQSLGVEEARRLAPARAEAEFARKTASSINGNFFAAIGR